MAEMTNNEKLTACIVIDVLDCFIGRIPGFELIWDAVSMYIVVKLWGPVGYMYGYELLDITGQIDGFIPTATLIARRCIKEEKKAEERALAARRAAAQANTSEVIVVDAA